MRWILVGLSLGLAACGGKVVVDGPGEGGGGGAVEPCQGFNRWCDYVTSCNGAAQCSEAICTLNGGEEALACLLDLPDEASCTQKAICTGD